MSLSDGDEQQDETPTTPMSAAEWCEWMDENPRDYEGGDDDSSEEDPDGC